MVVLKKWSFTQYILTVFAIVASATETAAHTFYLFGGGNAPTTLEHNRLIVNCRFGSATPFKNIQNVEEVQIYNCPPPEMSYAVKLRTLNVNISAIQELQLVNIKSETLLNAKHFKEFKLKKLSIDNSGSKSEMRLETSAFDLLTELTDLSLYMINLPPLSNASNVKNISVFYGSISGQKFSGCNELRELYLGNTYPENVSSYWLENCAKLEVLRTQGFSTHTSQKSLNHILEGPTNLQELDLSDCRLETLPWNWLTQAQKMRRLILSKNKLDGIVLRNIMMNSLNYLDLSYGSINSLKGLPVTNASQLEVNLNNNVIFDVQLQTKDYEMLEKNNVTVKVTGNYINYSLNCYDCKHGSLWRAVREKRLIINARCREKVKLGDADLKVRDRAECETFKCKKALQCECKQIMRTGVRLAYCENAELRTLPTEPGLHKLYADWNDIRNIYAEDLFDSLQFLDLRHNKISLVNATVVKKLFSVPERHVLFSHNPIACVCDNKEFLDALRTNQDRVDDYNSIACGGGKHRNMPIRMLHPADLCPQKSSSVSVHLGIVLAVLTVICLTLLVLYYRYKRTIKVFLYTRGWCLCCVREE